MLSPGIFYIKGTLKINTSGIVLRGSESTRIICTLNNYRTIIEINNKKRNFTRLYTAKVVDNYIPVNEKRIRVDDITKFKVGDSVIIEKSITDTFIKSLNMDILVRNDKPQVWLKSGSILSENRHIVAINPKNSVITLDIGLSDAIDSKMFSDITVTSYKYDYIYNIGIENMTFDVDKAYSGDFLTGHSMNGLTLCNMTGVIDCWMNNCIVNDFTSGIEISKNSSRITLNKIIFTRTTKNTGGAQSFDIYLSGSQVLISNGKSENKAASSKTTTISIGTMANRSGPNVVYNYIQNGVSLEPHMRWSSGLLVENVKGGDISIRNRGNMGSGHGWAMVNCTVWNCYPQSLNIQNPPGYKNFAIGCGGILNESTPFKGDTGEMESYDKPISYSLFETQKKNNNTTYTLGK